MFRPTQNTQIDIFNNFENNLPARKQRMLEDPNAWYNVFFSETLSCIDERIFSVLYDKRMGRPNASIRDLIGMIILKEGNGWSDQQLFENCRFNIAVIRALGKANLDEDVPVEATYYEFKRLLIAYNEEHGVDLLKMAFKDLVVKQMKKFGTQGQKIRMDSKLINSNIARSARLVLIIEAIRKFVTLKDIHIHAIKPLVDPELYELLTELKTQSSSNVLYPLNNDEKNDLLHRLGPAIQAIIQYYSECGYEGEYFLLLQRVFDEQYQVDEQSEQEKGSDQPDSNESEDPHTDKGNNLDTVAPKDPKQMGSSNLQSVHDPQATYREKGESINKQKVQGYHGNIAEVCDEKNELNLIIDAELKGANVSEHSFLLDSINECEQLMQSVHETSIEKTHHIKEVITDGGYDDVSNREEMIKPERPVWRLAKMKGTRQKFHMEYDHECRLIVIEKSTGQRCSVRLTQKGHKVVVKTPTGQERYYTHEEISNYMISQQIQSNHTKESQNLRANVEATINQVFHRLGAMKKVKYRGYGACRTYLISVVLWTNHRRINKSLINNPIKTRKFYNMKHYWPFSRTITYMNYLISNWRFSCGFHPRILGYF